MAQSDNRTKSSFLYSARFHNALTQVIVVGLFSYVLYWLINGTIHNLHERGIVSGFDFLSARVGFASPSNAFVFFNANSSNLVALLCGVANTIIMALICMVAATIIGLIVGIGRLSSNWLLRNICLVYMELFRNLPPLLVILFWSFGVFKAFLPSVRQSLSFGNIFFLNNQGFYFPKIEWSHLAWVTPVALLFGCGASIFLRRFAKNRQEKTGRYFATTKYYFLFLFILPALVFIFIGRPEGYQLPVLGRFSFTGGHVMPPETAALFLALSLYTGALISETFRAGFLAVDKGYIEAAAALGLKQPLVIRLIMLPLALRIILPPLSSQYMNLMKNTSLGVAIGYSELMLVGKQIQNNTNQSLEIILIWLVVYLGLSLFVSGLMNWFNRKMAFKGR